MITVTIVLAEITLALLIVLTVIGTKALRRRRRDRAAVNALVTRIKTDQPARVEKLAGVLRDSGQLNDEDALNKAHDLIKRQNKFYQEAIDLYFTRNHEVLSRLDGRLEDLLSQYQVTTNPADGQAPAVDNAMVEQLSNNITALSQDLDKLREENAALSEQLRAAEHELSQLGREYVSAFTKRKALKGAEGAPASPAEAPRLADDDEEAANAARDGEDAAVPAQEDDQERLEVIAGDDEPTAVTVQQDEAATISAAAQASDEDEAAGKGILTDLDLAELLAEPDQPPRVKKG